MHEFPYKTWLCAVFLLLMPWVTHAAGLGKLTVLSALGQPLSAEIDLMSVQKDEVATLSARIASPEAFQQANIQYSPALLGARLSIERRADGKPYIKLISLRPVNEPFIDLLVELSWAQGRLVREYTALVDPPGYTPTAPAPVAVAPVTPPVTVAPAPQAAEPASIAPPPPTTGRALAAPGSVPAARSGGTEYAVKRGDTLSRIAASTKPEGVTLEQMLVGLYRSNADAFAGNMNRLKTGKILRVPEKAGIAETAQPDAVKEVRVQAANWNAYRLKLAEAAGTTSAQPTAKAASGKIVTAVDDKAAGKEAPKEVLKLSKGDAAAAGKAGSGKPMSAQERVRTLEEEATAREKALAEANQRVTQLEKNIKDMQRLLEMKGAVPGAKPVAPVVPPATGDVTTKADATKAPPAKAEPPKTDVVAAAPGKDAGKAPAEAPKGDQKATTLEKPVTEPPKSEAIKGAEAPKADAVKTEQTAQPKPKPKVTAPPPPPPPPEPELVDQIISAASDPVYLGGALGGLAVLGGGAYWFARRRRNQTDDDTPAGVKAAPTMRKAAAAASVDTTAEPVVAAPPPAVVTDDVDPLAEADLYLNFGRDAQAEEVLKEALEKNPRHEEAQLKLLQIYAGRKDKVEFEKFALKLNTQTAGAGDNWLKAAAMGYAFDPENSLYAAGKSAPTPAAPATGGTPPSTDLDFDLELSPGTSVTATDVPLESGKAETTMMMEPGVLAAMAAVPTDATATLNITHDSAVRAAIADSAAAAPDFALGEQAGADSVTDIPLDAGLEQSAKGEEPAAPMAGAIDFNFDATTLMDVPATPEPSEPKHDSTLIITPEHQATAAALDMDFDIGGAASKEPAKPADTAAAPLDVDFKLDLGGESPAAPLAPEFKFDDINLSLDDAPRTDAAAPAAGGAKDDHWYDVQTKFDLAKAYQEMGDKDGAREILQEVIKEGDPAQQAEAKLLLDSIG